MYIKNIILSLLTILSLPLHAERYNLVWTDARQLLGDSCAAIVYAGISGEEAEGDFMHYEGSGNTEYRMGGYGTYTTKQSGTLSGHIQYARGKDRGIGWSAMRLPELYLPYISTDSCGGDFTYDRYYAEGAYELPRMGAYTIDVRASFFGEEAWRLHDPRALNNTTWLRFNAGVKAATKVGDVYLNLGYGRNKQHEQLRYWRPGQQDRFFVCYGFGLYDTRQSGVSFGKARMYYINEFNARLAYTSPEEKPLHVTASLGYARQHLETEESDIRCLYEASTNVLTPSVEVEYKRKDCPWQLRLSADARLLTRLGYENIIEEYLADVDYNTYDIRIIDSQQNYRRTNNTAAAALEVRRHICGRRAAVALEGGITARGFEEKYSLGGYSIKVNTSMPHVKGSVFLHSSRDEASLSVFYGRQTVGTHKYDVTMQNAKMKYLDFQLAFAPYAYRAADFSRTSVSATYSHRFSRITAGITGTVTFDRGRRADDVAYTGTPGFKSSAPMIQALPDRHNLDSGSLTLFLMF